MARNMQVYTAVAVVCFLAGMFIGMWHTSQWQNIPLTNFNTNRTSDASNEVTITKSLLARLLQL